ncbi:MAG: hypothetical protein ABI622_08805 [Chloroflexota bacterium]
MTQTLERKHVMVINDAEEIIELFRDILEGMGPRVSATTYAPARAMLDGQR